ACVLIYRIFVLQIVEGEKYLDSFQLMIQKEKAIEATRGCIYDRNGNILAYNELANSVTIEDVYKSGRGRNAEINATLERLIRIIEDNGDEIEHNFHITLNDNGTDYVFDVEGNQLLRFLADVYGRSRVSELKYDEKNKTARAVIDDLCVNFGIGGSQEVDGEQTFVPGLHMTKEHILEMVTIRYNMNANSYQKYIDTTVATGVSEQTVADVMENSDVLPGVSIAESTARVYVDAVYFSHVIGYTGRVSESELSELTVRDASYDRNDIVGKSGIEMSCEDILRGRKGSETLFVDTTGQVLDVSGIVEPVAGGDVYLTIDKDLQEACYHILERNLAGILLSRIKNLREYTNQVGSGSDIIIPIQDVYYALFNNHVIDIAHLSDESATETEAAIYALHEQKLEQVLGALEQELTGQDTAYQNLSKEMQVYESTIVSRLYADGILDSSRVDREDATYLAWTRDETISLSAFLHYCIAKDWVDVTNLKLDNQYADSEEIYSQLIGTLLGTLRTDASFGIKLYKYLIQADAISGRQICNLLLEQGKVTLSDEEQQLWAAAGESAYNFILNRISALDITPAQLALDPCTASMVVTDVNNGDVLALVSYPGYDNNRMANGVDSKYYASLRADLSNPLLNYATMQRTAPGSTYKMVTATAGLMEGVIDTEARITCLGVYDKINHGPRCWIYPGAHGSLNVTGGIRNSCNYFFFDLGYRMSIGADNAFHSEIGLEKLRKYADLYGLTEKSGIEITEYDPIVSDMDAVRSAIGQGTNSYTTVGLARYVTAVANSGVCYELTLIDRTTDSNGHLLEDNHARIRNTIDMDSSYWNAIHRGMRQVVEDKSYYSDLSVKVAGKTGTAQESASRGNHSLFVCYAPYENPEIAIATRIAFGYTSSYAAQLTRDAVEYYFGLRDESEITEGTAIQLQGGAANAD
ncbi:MAG: penicillin-binding protein, partial [Butyrivibrio sp.]|nr:penicillin-binding protein [Butyrivibrio sp.]